jgi:hypothetical protein
MEQLTFIKKNKNFNYMEQFTFTKKRVGLKTISAVLRTP